MNYVWISFMMQQKWVYLHKKANSCLVSCRIWMYIRPLHECVSLFSGVCFEDRRNHNLKSLLFSTIFTQEEEHKTYKMEEGQKGNIGETYEHHSLLSVGQKLITILCAHCNSDKKCNNGGWRLFLNQSFWMFPVLSEHSCHEWKISMYNNQPSFTWRWVHGATSRKVQQFYVHPKRGRTAGPLQDGGEGVLFAGVGGYCIIQAWWTLSVEHVTGACCGPWTEAPCGCHWGDPSERWGPGRAAGLGPPTEELLAATSTTGGR